MTFDLTTLAETLGPVATKALENQLDKLAAQAGDPLKRAILKLVQKTVEERGLEGVKLAAAEVQGIMDGRGVNIYFTDIETGAVLLAHLENCEADRKKAVTDFFAQVGQVLGAIAGALLKGAVGG